jgi:hypothetical protein
MARHLRMLIDGWVRSGLSSRSDDLDSVGELYIEDDFRRLTVAIESRPPKRAPAVGNRGP